MKKHRFKRWLIHKLGGIYKDDICVPQATVYKQEMREVTSQMFLTKEEYRRMEVNLDDVLKCLVHGLIRDISNSYFIVRTEELENKYRFSIGIKYIDVNAEVKNG